MGFNSADEVEGCGVKSGVHIVRVSDPALVADLALSTGENTNLAHLSERDAELLEERILVAGERFHQLFGALVVEQRLVRGE